MKPQPAARPIRMNDAAGYLYLKPPDDHPSPHVTGLLFWSFCAKLPPSLFVAFTIRCSRRMIWCSHGKTKPHTLHNI